MTPKEKTFADPKILFLRIGVRENFQERLLVGGLDFFLTFHILGILLPFDFHIFQRGRSTTNETIFVEEWSNGSERFSFNPMFSIIRASSAGAKASGTGVFGRNGGFV